MLKTLLKFFNRSTIAAPVRNRNMMGFADKQAFLDQRLKAEETRAKENRPHEVLYFHKVDDPYSYLTCLLYTSPSPRDKSSSRMPSSA